MTTTALLCAKAALEKKAEKLVILDLSKLSCFTDFFILCNGNSDRQVKAISDSIEAFLSKQKIKPLNIEGYSEGRWVLLDYGDVIVHVFQDMLRDYFDLEALWSQAMKVKIPTEYYTETSSSFSHF